MPEFTTWYSPLCQTFLGGKLEKLLTLGVDEEHLNVVIPVDEAGQSHLGRTRRLKGASISTKTDSVHMFIGMYGLQFDLIYSILCGRQSIILDLVCQIC